MRPSRPSLVPCGSSQGLGWLPSEPAINRDLRTSLMADRRADGTKPFDSSSPQPGRLAASGALGAVHSPKPLGEVPFSGRLSSPIGC